NGAAQDGLPLLRSMQFRLDLFLSQQLRTIEESQSAHSTLESWKKQYQNLHMSLRNANLQAKKNIRKAAQEERELLLGGGEESTIRRRNLQTKAGMTSAAESIIASLRRTRQLMVQVDRSANTLATFEESTSVLKKAEGEYKGHRSLLMRTRRLLSTMQRQDVMDRVILVTGFLMFLSAVLYVVSKRVGLLKLQRKLLAAIKAGSEGHEEVVVEIQRAAVGDGLNHAPAHENVVPQAEIPVPCV
ncbi:LOW QUALITY PROTEIN: uncharacterized protein, partial [Elaeis guineensis]|uniref:LOW QUALITY PROTEIN: uncharacterized protein n=1 Tax=Elaeis guineensis var. tenera TaxID=51953 RepID=UPI003C6D7CED